MINKLTLALGIVIAVLIASFSLYIKIINEKNKTLQAKLESCTFQRQTLSEAIDKAKLALEKQRLQTQAYEAKKQSFQAKINQKIQILSPTKKNITCEEALEQIISLQEL